MAQLAKDFIGSVSSARRNFETFLAATRHVVAGTCVGLGRASLGLTTTAFDLVIVDEAARCTAGELSVPLQAGRWIILVGDHFQLEPQHHPTVVAQVAKELSMAQAEVLRSDFERVFLSGYGAAASCILTEQYRMLEPIGAFASSAFYNSQLTHGRADPLIPPEALPETLEVPLTWFATDGFGASGFQKEAPGRQGALENPVEADLIVALLRQWDHRDGLREWLERGPYQTSAIGIICTYRAQSDLIKAKLRSSFLSETLRQAIKIDTVDSYQGKENPIVILSLVRNNVDGWPEGTERTIKQGFMARANRLNVAVTRAMDRLVLVGASNRWPQDGPMNRVSRAFRVQEGLGRARFIDAVAFRGLLDVEPSRGRRKKGVRQDDSTSQRLS